MPELSAYLRECFNLIADWLMETGARGKLHLGPGEMSLSLARKLKARLKLAEELIRRLIWQIGAGLTLAPTRPGGPRSDQDRAPRRRLYSFALLHPANYYARALEMLRERERPAKPNRPEIGPLLARWKTLSAIAKDPMPTARRMARRLARIRAKRQIMPLALPFRGEHRLPTELSLMASFALHDTNDALRLWLNSS
ncbi:hypothetical protein WNY37_01380 [Henriciella sp. AS95]|uniref:hypothetical protein n=1 Tax=Henriciella sp. AS95 TaxID=3135782 RepID=UPI00317A0E67